MNRKKTGRPLRDFTININEIQKDKTITLALMDYRRLADDIDNTFIKLKEIKKESKKNERVRHSQIIKKNCHKCVFFQVGVCRFARILFVPKKNTCKNFVKFEGYR